MKPNSINQIKNRLRAAIGSDKFMWSNYYDRNAVHEAWASDKSEHTPGGSLVCECTCHEHGNFIANAPDDIRFLLKEVGRLRSELTILTPPTLDTKLPEYSVRKAYKTDKLYGPHHGSNNAEETLCGLNISEEFWITHNRADGKVTCKKCLKELKK